MGKIDLKDKACRKWVIGQNIYVYENNLFPGGCLPLPRGYIHVYDNNIQTSSLKLLSYLSSLFIAILRSLDTEANRFYDRNNQMYDAALLTRCYSQHALLPFIDSESNHIRRFIHIPFINKGIDFIDLPSIVQDKSEPPIICYKYKKPIRNTIFNFNKLVSDLDIHANTHKS